MTRWDEFKRMWLPTPWHAAFRNQNELKVLLDLTKQYRTIDSTVNQTLRYLGEYIFDRDATNPEPPNPDFVERWCQSRLTESHSSLAQIPSVNFSYRPYSDAFSTLRVLVNLKLAILEQQIKRFRQIVLAGTLNDQIAIDLILIEHQRQFVKIYSLEAEYYSASRDTVRQFNPKHAILEANRLRSCFLAELTSSMIEACESRFEAAKDRIQGACDGFESITLELNIARENIGPFNVRIAKLRDQLGAQNNLIAGITAATSDFDAEINTAQSVLDTLASFAKTISGVISKPIESEHDLSNRIVQIKHLLIRLESQFGKLENISDKRLTVLTEAANS